MNWFIPEWLLALSLTLFVLDLCLQTEILTYCGIALLSGWLTWRLGVSVKWSVCAFLLFLIGFSMAYFFFFRATLGKAVSKMLTKDAPQEIVHRIVGARGRIHIVEGKPFFKWNGEELLPVDEEASGPLDEGRIVTVVAMKDGDVTVS